MQGEQGSFLAPGIDSTRDEKLFENSEDGMLISTDEGRVLDANAAARRLLGRTRAEIAAAGRNDVFWDSRLKEAIEKRRRKGSFRGKLRLARQDGSTFEAEVSAIDLEDRKVGIVFREAGQREQSGETLEGALVEGFFKALVENRTGVVILTGEDGVIRYASPSVERILGHEPEKVIGDDLAEHLHPDDREKAREVFTAETPKGMVSGSFRLRHGGGGWVEIEGSIENLLEDPEIEGVALVGREASPSEGEDRAESGFEEKLKSMVARLEESERRLRESERLFRTTFDEAPIGIAHVGVDGRWIRVNKKLCEILGRSRKELLGHTGAEITHTEDLEADMGAMNLMLSGDEDSVSVEKRFVKKDFTHVWVGIAASLINDEEGRPRYFICTIEDITNIKEAQLIARSMNDRETQVLKLLGSGMTNREIAAEMNFSLSSAKVHVGRVVAKLGASDRTNAAVRAASLGIL